jgi:hypothetical protein
VWPFQNSTNVVATPVSALVVYPTAAQAFAETHDTASNEVVDAPVGLGVAWIAQWRPFHRSANVTWVAPPAACPTATQLLADVHDTAPNALFGAPDGFGVGVMRHVRPFQTSANVPPKVTPGSVEYAPTATQYRADGHDTEES